MGKSNKRYTVHTIVFVFTSLFVSYCVQAMDEPIGKDAPVYVATSDAQVKRVERWKIDQMKTLLVLFEHQRGTNSVANPLRALMITKQELDLLCDALVAISEGAFDVFYSQLASESMLPHQVLAQEKGVLRMLINAAQKVEAKGLSSFCLSTLMPNDADYVVPYFINEFIEKISFAERTLVPDIGYVSSLAFSPDGKKLVMGCRGYFGNVRVYDMETGVIVKFKIEANVDVVAFSPDGTIVVSSGKQSGEAIVWDAATGEQLKIFQGYPYDVFSLAFSRNGKMLAVGYAHPDDNLLIWDTASWQSRPLVGQQGPILALQFSPDGGKLTSCGDNSDGNGNVTMWDTKTWQPEIVKEGLLNCSIALFSHDGKKLLFGYRVRDAENDVAIMDLVTKKTSMLKYYMPYIEAAALSPDGTILVVGGSNYYKVLSAQNNLIAFDIATGSQQVLKGYVGRVEAVAFSPNGNLLAVGGRSSLMLWSLLSADDIRQLKRCTLAQALFLYEIVLAKERGLRMVVNPYQLAVFNSFDDSVRALLQRKLGIVAN